MNRRSLFRILAGATAAAAMEVCGLLPVRRAEIVAFCPRVYVGEIVWTNIYFEKSTPTSNSGWYSTLQNS
jgi:hypothetical protein